VTGFNVRSLAAGSGASLQASSSATNENAVIDAKGSGVVTLGANSTGGVSLASGGGPTTAGPIITTAPQFVASMGIASNISIAASVASNALTVTVNGADGNPLSASNPAYFPVRDNSLTTSVPTWAVRTLPLSITLPAGSTMGIPANTYFRLWLVAFISGGAVSLALYQSSVASGTWTIRALKPGQDVVSTTLISGAATSPGAFYGTSGLSSRPYSVLGFLEFAPQATAGNYTAAPSKIVLYQPGVPMPGDRVGLGAINQGAGGNSSSTTPVETNGSRITYSMQFQGNFTVVSYTAAANSSVLASTNTSCTVALSKVGVGNLSSQVVSATSASGGLAAQGAISMQSIDLPNSASQAYCLNQNTSNASAACGVVNVNGRVEELMV
jgi:hypothetical protein